MTFIDLAAILDTTSPDAWTRRQAGAALVTIAGIPAVDVRILAVLLDPDRHVGQLAIDRLVTRADAPAVRLLAFAIHHGGECDPALPDLEARPVMDAILWSSSCETIFVLAHGLREDADPDLRAGASYICASMR